MIDEIKQMKKKLRSVKMKFISASKMIMLMHRIQHKREVKKENEKELAVKVCKKKKEKVVPHHHHKNEKEECKNVDYEVY